MVSRRSCATSPDLPESPRIAPTLSPSQLPLECLVEDGGEESVEFGEGAHQQVLQRGGLRSQRVQFRRDSTLFGERRMSEREIEELLSIELGHPSPTGQTIRIVRE